VIDWRANEDVAVEAVTTHVRATLNNHLIEVAHLISTALDDPTMKMVALSVAGFGIFGSLPVFWTFPAAFLSGAAAAGGIALINSIGNLAGFAGPYVVGRIKDATGS
jgi:hypothetical protein